MNKGQMSTLIFTLERSYMKKKRRKKKEDPLKPFWDEDKRNRKTVRDKADDLHRPKDKPIKFKMMA